MYKRQVHIGIGKFGQWYTDSDLVEQDNNALLLKEDLPVYHWPNLPMPIDVYKRQGKVRPYTKTRVCMDYEV